VFVIFLVGAILVSASTSLSAMEREDRANASRAAVEADLESCRAELLDALRWREAEALVAEVARLKGETYCAYCGERFPLDAPDATTQIGAHIGTCPKHPMRAVEAERDALKAELREAIKSGAWLQGELTEAKGQLVVLKYDNTPKKEEP